MSLFNKHFALGFFSGFVFFVVILVAAIYVLTGNRANSLINKEQKAEILGLQQFPPSEEVDVYDGTSSWILHKIGGSSFGFKEFKGKVVFVNFWATWCGPCIAEMPAIQELYDSLSREEVQFALISNEPEGTITDFLERHRYTFPVYRTDDNVPEVFPVGGIPTTFVLNKKGTIVLKHIGFAKWNHRWMLSFMRGLQ